MLNLRNYFNVTSNTKTRTLIIHFRKRSRSVISDYQYIQRSIIPTLHFQNSLPRLPIPELQKSCERYLQALKPLLNDDDYKITELIVKKFEKEEGLTLQNDLIELDSKNKNTSYISEPWFNMYLSDRTSLPINYNPCLIHVNNDYNVSNNQLVKSTNLIISSLRFYKSLTENLLEPEVFHLKPKRSDTLLFRKFTSLLPSSISWYGAYLFNAYPLDMSQYSSLFNSTRIPEIGKDRLYQNEKGKHILAIRKGNFYTFDVLDENGNILNPELILSCIHEILNDNSGSSEYPLGVLTTMDRNKWAKSRKHLENIGNKETLEIIDSSLFAIALDDVNLESTIDIIKWFLHSDGINRWFDKSFTLISTSNGFCGINFEHSWGDGVAVLRYFQDIYNYSTNEPKINENTQLVPLNDYNSPKKLNFVIDEEIKQDVNDAKLSFKKVDKSLSVYDVMYDIGKIICKVHKVSPDAIMQLAFQLAYYKLKTDTTATYESCSTAAFKHGRTEAIRSCTVETKKFCEAVSTIHFNNDQLREMIMNCSKVHGELVKNCAMGYGFDRHLFALRKLAENTLEDIPKLFTDKGYQLINHNILSTSTLSSDTVLCGGFGPVVKNGFGIGYMMRDEVCGAIITNYKDHTDGDKFAAFLKKSLEKIHFILMNN